ncbi:hypothetical protein JCM8208_005663 [Rhodotorula glutinis]
MRQKRTKGARKVMQLYQSAFGFREPYQLLMDAAFVQSSVKQKFELMSRLHDVLQGVVKPMITQCCMQALYNMGEEAQDVVDVAKGFERRMCNHLKARSEDECLTAMAGSDNRNRYVFATQSLALRQALRKVPGSPIIYIARSVLLLEAPSDQTLAKKHQMETAKLHVSAQELAAITGKPIPSSAPEPSTSTSTAAADGAPDAAPKKPRKPKGPKGPNPLSVRSKKKGAAPGGGGGEAGGRPPKKRSRDGEEHDGVDREAEREGKRKREEESKVASMPTRGDGEARKKRKRRKKGTAGGGAGGGEAAEGGGNDGGGSGDE